MNNYDGAKLIWTNRRVHTQGVVIGEVRYEPGGFCGPRLQRDYELVVIHSGEGEVQVDGVTRLLSVGQVFLFLPGCREYYRFARDRETHHSYCSMSPALMTPRLKSLLARAPEAVPQSDVFRLILAAAFRLRTLHGVAASQLIHQVGLCLFHDYLHASRNAERRVNTDPAVRTFLDHLHDHFGEEECLANAHRSAGVSRNALIYKFRAQLESTPARYLWRYRTERGIAMLAETGHTIAEIAFRCGFKSPFHFSRLVKTHSGRSPRALRSDVWTKAAPGRAAEAAEI